MSTCTLCHKEIGSNESFVGMGNGFMRNNGEFAHYACYNKPIFVMMGSCSIMKFQDMNNLEYFLRRENIGRIYYILGSTFPSEDEYFKAKEIILLHF